MVQRFPGIGMDERLKTTPIPVQRTNRTQQLRVLTSLPAGKMVPLAAIPLLREDSVAGCNMRIAFEQKETVEVLMNAVNVRVMTYFVPKLALERFPGLDALNRSYEGKPMVDGGPVTPWFELQAHVDDGSNKILYHLGKHARAGQLITTDYLESYNVIWNYRATQRSKNIPLRTRLQKDLAPGFWIHQNFAHIVPDFDQAVIDGEVALNMTGTAINTKVNVTGIGVNTGAVAAAGKWQAKDAVSNPAPGSGAGALGFDAANTSGFQYRAKGSGATSQPDIYADIGAVFNEMVNNGITVSLSNIELARKTQAFANLRKQYQGHSDEYIIDLLMDGISIPDERWKQPMLLSDDTTVFGMSKRYASDGASLTESVVNGLTYVDVRFSLPRANPGGVIMVVAEIAPEQLFERQMDPYLHAQGVEWVPQFLRDTLDPEKVQIVQNQEVDIDHDTPVNTFGYAPLNHQWARSIPHIGGKFFRPDVNAPFDEDRQRIWAVETENPVLSRDFYLTTNMHYKPFVVTDLAIDPYECLIRGSISIRGNTVFGGALVEAYNDYAEVMEEAPQARIDKPDTPAVP